MNPILGPEQVPCVKAETTPHHIARAKGHPELRAPSREGGEAGGGGGGGGPVAWGQSKPLARSKPKGALNGAWLRVAVEITVNDANAHAAVAWGDGRNRWEKKWGARCTK